MFVSAAGRRTLAVALPAATLSLGLLAGSAGATGGGSGTAGSVQLPRDAAPHHVPVEWWYFSGHLSGRTAGGALRSFGFEYVTFQFTVIGPKPLYVGNFAVTDLRRKSFVYGAEQASYAIPDTPGRFALHTAGWSMSGGSTTDVLHAATGGYDIDLRLVSEEPPVLEGPGGVVSLGPLGTSYYYSWTSLRTSGELVDHGVVLEVSGLSWMDHEWGTINVLGGYGWDWFSIQLTDGRQYMLYFIRNRSGKIVQELATTASASRSTVLPAAVLGERATGSWTSPATHIHYGMGWQLTVPGGHLTVAPELVDQELDLSSLQGNSYWEGDCSITGVVDGKAVSGSGYTEPILPASSDPSLGAQSVVDITCARSSVIWHAP